MLTKMTLVGGNLILKLNTTLKAFAGRKKLINHAPNRRVIDWWGQMFDS